MQIWIAVSVFVLVASIKKRLRISFTLYEIPQIMCLHLFEKSPLFAALTTDKSRFVAVAACKLLIFFN
ncbi:MAG: hypothetical protein ACYC9J_15040 [Sulfuricaulis sp.]